MNQQAKDKAKEFVLTMLGAPIVKVELEESQINLAIESAARYIEMQSNNRVVQDVKFLYLLCEGALIHSKFILGRIRSKYEESSSFVDARPSDGRLLLEEAKEELVNWKWSVEDAFLRLALEEQISD